MDAEHHPEDSRLTSSVGEESLLYSCSAGLGHCCGLGLLGVSRLLNGSFHCGFTLLTPSLYVQLGGGR